MPAVIREHDDEALALIAYNLQRPKTWSQRARELELALERTAPAAADRRRAGGRRGGLSAAGAVAKVGHTPPQRAMAEAAKSVGLGRENARKLLFVHRAVRDGVLAATVAERLDHGQVTLNWAFLEARRGRSKSDQSRPAPQVRRALDAAVRTSDVWAWHRRDPWLDPPGVDPLLGSPPPQAWAALIHLYAPEGSLLVDLTAGAGTAAHVAGLMGRRCLSFDLTPRHTGIRRHDLTGGLPDLGGERPSLVLIDPPYGDQRLYSRKRGDLCRCRSAGEYLDRLEAAVLRVREACAGDTRIALVCGNGEMFGERTDAAMLMAARLVARGAIPRRISVPYPPQHHRGNVVLRARRRGELLWSSREILVLPGAAPAS